MQARPIPSSGGSPPGTIRARLPLLAAVGVIAILVFVAVFPKGDPSGPKATALGVAYSPANLPNSSPQDVSDFFVQARAVGSHVSLIVDWATMPAVADIAEVERASQANGLAFHLYLSPIALYGGRKDPSIPAAVGGTSFNETGVRQAFVAQALELAGLRPNVLGLGTEVNLLAQNPSEFAAYVSLTREAYVAIKSAYASQSVAISFQWDILLTQGQFDALPPFAASLDVYAFTTYPSFFVDPARIPGNYYTSVRSLLPTQRVGFSEVGWPSAGNSSEATQAEYYARLPALFAGVGTEFVTLALLHDVALFVGELEALNSVGIRQRDGRPKASWDVVVALPRIG